MSQPNLFEQVCEAEGWECTTGKAVIPLADGRSQTLFAATFEEEGAHLMRLHTVVGRSDMLTETRLRAALSLNGRLRYGAFAIIDEQLVVTDTVALLATAVRSSARYLAETADRYEKAIFGTDSN